MKEKFHYRVGILFLVLALVGAGCAAPATATEPPTAEVQATAAPPTRQPPPRMPPPGVDATTAPPTEAPAPVAGNVEACKLPGRTPDDVFDYNLLGIPRLPGYAPSTGTLEVAVLFADYSDARANSSPEEELAILPLTQASEILREVSYGRLDVVFKPFPTWLHLPQSTAYYKDLLDKNSDEGERPIYEEAIKLAGANVDFSDTDYIILILNPQASGGTEGAFVFTSSEDTEGIQAGGRSIPAGTIMGNYIRLPQTEELLRNHTIARFLSTAMTLMRHGFRDTTLFPDLTDEERRSATGSFSLMGNNLDKAHAPGVFAYERWHLGWLDDEQIFCQTGGEQTTELSAIEGAGGMKAVMVPLGEQCALVVESRRATGTDQDLIKEGALVYTVDTSVKQNGVPIRVLPLPAAEDDLFRDQAPLAEGESLTYSNLTITNVAAREDGDTVRVTVAGENPCPQAQDITSTIGQVATTSQTAIPVLVGAECGLSAIPGPTQADVMVRFVNESGFEAVGFWQDASQSPVKDLEYFNVANGGAYNQETFEGDKWIIKEPSGGTLVEYIASGDEKQCVLIKRPLGGLWIDFINESGVPAIGYLVDANGNIQEYFRVGVGATTGLWTANGLAWRVLDGNGNVLLDYTSTNAPEQRVVIPPFSGPANTPVPTNTALPSATSTPEIQIPIDPATNCPVIEGAQVTCYDIEGSTEDELRTSLDQRSPFAPADAHTEWNIAWNWPGYGTNTCDLSAATVTLTELKITMPRWEPPANASPELVAKWEKYIQDLAIHQKASADVVLDNYLNIRTAIQNATCTTANTEAQKALDSLNELAEQHADQTGNPVFP